MVRYDGFSSLCVAADEAVAAIRTPDDLKAKQAAWHAWWLDALGGMPERTPLNARVAGTVECDGFRLENIVFESQPGVFVTAHLALPKGATVPCPVVLMPLGHSNDGILNPRYAAHLAMTARARRVCVGSDFAGRTPSGG